MFRTKPVIPHLCLAPRALSTVEHLGAVARQATECGLEVCWLDLGDQPDLRGTVRHYVGDVEFTDASTERALRRHLSSHRPRAVWLQSPYGGHYPDWFWKRTAGILGYSGYGLTLSTWLEGLYGLDVYPRCRIILTESDYIRNNYIEHGVSPAIIMNVGNPLLFDLRARLQDAPPPTTDVLWAPHWTEDWFGSRGYTRWREAVGPLFEWAKAHPDSRVAVRPHPLLPAGIDGLPDSDAEAAMYRRLVDLPNVAISERSLADDILDSRTLITDGVSIIAYWSATGRPLGITRDAESPPFNETGNELCTAADLLGSPAEVADWLRRLDEHRASPERRALSERVHPTLAVSPIAAWLSDRAS